MNKGLETTKMALCPEWIYNKKSSNTFQSWIMKDDKEIIYSISVNLKQLIELKVNLNALSI